MKYETPVNVKTTSGPGVTDGAPDSVHFYDPFPRDRPAVSRLQGRWRKINKQRAWASVFWTLAVLGMLVSCIRAVHPRATIAGAARKLASGENEEDHERAAILDLCLGLQEERGVITQEAAPPPGPSEAIPLILEFLGSSQVAGPQQFAGPQQTVPPSFPSLETATPAPTSEPGPTHVAAARWGAGDMQVWDDPVQTAKGEVPPHVEDEGVAGPSTAPLQRFHETPLQGSPITTYQAPIFQLSATEGPHFFSFAVSASGRKRGIMESQVGGPRNPAKQTEWEGALQQPLAKKPASGWKKRAPSTSPVPLLPVQQDPQEVASDVPGKDPIFQGMQALRAMALQPWQPLGTAGDESQPTGPGEEHTHTSPVQATPHSSQQPGIHLSPEEPPLAEIGSPTSPASAGCPLPSASLGLCRPWEAPPESPLPGPSRPALTETSSTPLPSGDDKSLEQILSAGPPAHSDQSRLASHLFYRLPTLLPGPIPRTFNPANAFTEANSRARSILSLRIIRALLVRPAITPQDAATLVAYSEVLAGRLYRDLQVPLNNVRTSRVVDLLGRAFFALDALLSVIELVGQPMDAQGWWPKLAGVIPEQISFPFKPTASAVTVYNARLATRLSIALQNLKRGQRLGAGETVQLKRELLTKALAIPKFKSKKWDPWRDDDEKSKGSVGT